MTLGTVNRALGTQLAWREVRIILHVLFWFGFTGVSIFFFSNFWPLQTAILRGITNGLLFVGMFYLNLLVLIPWLLARRRYLLYAMAIAAAAALYITVRILFRDFFFGRPPLLVFTQKPFQSGTMIITSFLFIIGLSIVYRLGSDHLRSLDRNREIVRQRDEIELQMLKSQVNPHFLFNTLNNLYTLAYTRSDKTPGAIMALAEIMRYLIYESGAGRVPLESEIRFLTNYVELERLRLDDPSRVALSTGSAPEGLDLAPLLFIALVENAFKHSGISSDPEGFIQIFLTVEGTRLFLTVENSISTLPATDQKGGFGLANMRSRLELLYPGRAKLEIRQTPHIHTASLTLDL